MRDMVAKIGVPSGGPARRKRTSRWLLPSNLRDSSEEPDKSGRCCRARDDKYLKLRQRIKLARAQNADLFVSLHADSAASKSARGMSVFTLSETASDKEAAALARNENKADLIGGPDLGVEDPEAANELLRMFQRESMNQSTHFAGKILEEIRDMPGGDKRGHRFAGFAVLKAPDMPSVLVEMGFLSNREDEANLNRKSYRRKLAGRLTGAIVRYLEEFGPEI